MSERATTSTTSHVPGIAAGLLTRSPLTHSNTVEIPRRCVINRSTFLDGSADLQLERPLRLRREEQAVFRDAAPLQLQGGDITSGTTRSPCNSKKPGLL